MVAESQINIHTKTQSNIHIFLKTISRNQAHAHSWCTAGCGCVPGLKIELEFSKIITVNDKSFECEKFSCLLGSSGM